jgi:hypothetical protein
VRGGLFLLGFLALVLAGQARAQGLQIPVELKCSDLSVAPEHNRAFNEKFVLFLTNKDFTGERALHLHPGKEVFNGTVDPGGTITLIGRGNYDGDRTNWQYTLKGPINVDRIVLSGGMKVAGSPASRTCTLAFLVTTAELAATLDKKPAPSASVVTASELEAVRQKIRPCWNGAGGPRDPPAVTIVVQMSSNGTPTDAAVRDTDRYNRDPAYRVVADSARRAILNPRCQPWPLSLQTYNSWRSITFTFDPREF